MTTAQEGGGTEGASSAPQTTPDIAGALGPLSRVGVLGAAAWSGTLPWLIGIVCVIVVALIVAAGRKDPAMFERLLDGLVVILGRTVAGTLAALRETPRVEGPPT